MKTPKAILVKLHSSDGGSEALAARMRDVVILMELQSRKSVIQAAGSLPIFNKGSRSDPACRITEGYLDTIYEW